MDDPNYNTDSLCTRAITGNVYPTHQPIYICDTCQLYKGKDEGGSSNAVAEEQEEEMEEPLPSCICQSCALNCHIGHDVYFVGIGPCTCDCLNMVLTNNLGNENEGSEQRHSCQLVEQSEMVARRIGFTELRLINHPLEVVKKISPPLHLMPVANNERSDDGTDKDETNNNIKNATLHGDISQQLSNLCLDCSSTLDGYTFSSYTLPGLLENNNRDDNNDNGICQHLIRQAEVLITHSKETFWIPDYEMNSDNINNGDYAWCDLEVLANQIYKQHVQSYSLQSSSTTKKDADKIIKPGTTSEESGGLEWWVQVKPAGSRDPVNLHYDKDEVLAETFGLGSFPTLSTVTYLTEEKTNSPTVVFPHTYHDEEDRPIESMLLSHAAKGKHIVFDGRLLHGAPAHDRLLRHSVGVADDESAGEDESPLRVTFLVNIWKSGRPAGVNILPDYIRSKIQSSASLGPTASFRSMMPLEFQHRGVSQLSIPNSSFVGEEIVLPFVSNGDDEEVNVEEESEEEDGLTREEQSAGVSNDDEDINDDDYEEEEGELVLVLPPFDMPEKADTIILSFGEVNPARLMRDGAFTEQDGTAANFILYLHEHVPTFVSSIITKLESQHGIDVTTLRADHVCYRTDSVEQYTSLIEALQSYDDVTLLVESEIGGRLIATFKLTVPIEIYNSENGSTRRIDVIEIPSPKKGSSYMAGLEHVEFVIGDGSHRSALNDGVHQTALKAWMDRFPSVSWNTADKVCNPDVSMKLELEEYGKVSVKFHLLPLEDVIKFEVATEK